MTTRAQEPMFSKPRPHIAKDVAIVTLAGLIIAGFLAHAWRPQVEPPAVAPATFLAQR